MTEKDRTQWPFAIVRSHGSGDANPRYMEALLAAQDRHPGLIGEIWFSGGDALMDEAEIRARGVAANVKWRDACRSRGIAFSFQQGVTLNHGADGPHKGFSTDAWVVDARGRRLEGMLCPNSPEALEGNRRVAEIILSELKPDSYWPDDDLRYSKGGDMRRPGPHLICFCDRCMALFNKETGGSWSRETLANALFGDTPDAAARVAWVAFNRRNLGRFAAVYREVADRVHPSCRLGIQLVHSCERYDGLDFKPMLEALSGPGKQLVGARPGAGYYMDECPWDMIDKARQAMLEATRCAKYGFVGQVCYESENWPHVSAEKNPGSQMLENALALASGCDSLALYWGTDSNGESSENYAFYFDTFAKWKPYLLAVRDAFAGTVPCGLCGYDGAGSFGVDAWMWRADFTERRLAQNSLPLACEGGFVEATWINARRVAELVPADFPRLFSGCVLMDAYAFRALAEKFPDLPFVRAVKYSPLCEQAPATAKIDCFEVFPGGLKSRGVTMAYEPVGKGVETFSSLNGMPGACGTCTVPTGFGGHVVLMQDFDAPWLWTAPRRKAVLDAIESVAGPMHVRLLTGGYSVAVIARVDAEGRTAGAFLVNGGCGETPPLEIALRRPAFGKWRVRAVGGMVAADCSSGAGDVVVKLPPMAGWTSLLVEGVRAGE